MTTSVITTAPLPPDHAGEAETLAALTRTWKPRGGFWGWMTSVDHKSIGKRYIATCLVFFKSRARRIQ